MHPRPVANPLQPAARLLVVDDDRNLRESIARGLTRQGFHLELAEDGRTAVERAFREHFDLLLLDQMMPGLSGIDVLRLLRATYSQTALPVIMLTGLEEGTLLEEALENGANDYVAKPVNLQVIAARIRSQLERSHAERRELETDSLTGLGNRRHLVEQLHGCLLSNAGNPVLFFLDLDGFKAVNDGFGHAVGDVVLVETATRLRTAIQDCGMPPNGHVLARLGGDEFVVLLKDASAGQHERLACAILASISRPFFCGKLTLSLTGSVGSVEGTKDVAAEELLRDADLAMYHAKQSGGNQWRNFDPSMRTLAHTRISLTTDLRTAVEKRELLAVYQPQVSMATRKILGFECLLRWHHLQHGWVPPSKMIPMAEESGLIIPIGMWVLEQACRQLRIWQEAFPRPKPLSMSVNLSVRQLAQPSLVDDIQRIAETSGIVPGSLRLELTESSVMSNIEFSQEVLSRLRALRIGVELDDFGTGYSSFSYLRTIRFDSLKIDRSFVSNLAEESAEGRAIVGMVTNMAHAMDMEVIGEGVETEEQFRILASLGCDVGQGYLLGMPQEPDAIDKLLRDDGAPASGM